MVQLLFYLAKSARPRQALKNLSLFAPLIFSGNLFITGKFLTALWATFIFTILTSSIYILNDLVDLPHDKIHPFKKNRPITSGLLPIPIAVFSLIVGVITSLYLGATLNFFFFLVLLAYLTLQVSYTVFFKNIIIIDVLIIATGFILRVYAGALAINVHMSVWFLLCVISLALFLAVGKRRSELGVLLENAPKHRKTLTQYTPTLLDAYLGMFATSAWLSYALFTFFAPPAYITNRLSIFTNLPQALVGTNKWLMVTVPLVIFGLMRYLWIVYQGTKAETPERVLLSDKPLLGSVIAWGVLTVLIIYGVKS